MVFVKDMKLFGLWLGPTLAVAYNYGRYQYELNMADWDEVSERI